MTDLYSDFGGQRYVSKKPDVSGRTLFERDRARERIVHNGLLQGIEHILSDAIRSQTPKDLNSAAKAFPNVSQQVVERFQSFDTHSIQVFKYMREAAEKHDYRVLVELADEFIEDCDSLLSDLRLQDEDHGTGKLKFYKQAFTSLHNVFSVDSFSLRDLADFWVRSISNKFSCGGGVLGNDNNGMTWVHPLSFLPFLFLASGVTLGVWTFINLPTSVYWFATIAFFLYFAVTCVVLWFSSGGNSVLGIAALAFVPWFFRFNQDFIPTIAEVQDKMFLLFPWWVGMLIALGIFYPTMYVVKKRRASIHGPLATLWLRRVSKERFPAWEVVVVNGNDEIVYMKKTRLMKHFLERMLDGDTLIWLPFSLKGDNRPENGQWILACYPSFAWLRGVKRFSTELYSSMFGWFGLSWIIRFPRPWVPQKFIGDAEFNVIGLSIESLEDYWEKHPHMPTEPPGYEEAAVNSAE